MDKKKVVCLGELLIDFVPETNGLSLVDVPAFTKAAGGAPANVAAAISKLGGSSRFIGKIGQDPFGAFLKATLEAEGVDAALIETQEANTCLAFVSLREDGERDFLFYRDPSADMLLRSDDIPDEWLNDAAIYHFGSVSLIHEPCRSATIEAAKRAKKMGAVISYDPNVRLALWPNAEAARAEIIAHLPMADIVKVSEEEIAFLYETDVATGAKRMLDEGVQAVIVTLGGAGCRIITSQADTHVAGLSVEVVDTTGAGDSFVGGLLYQISERAIGAGDIAERLSDANLVQEMCRFANVVAGLTTTKRGAIPALPTMSEVEAKLSSF